MVTLTPVLEINPFGFAINRDEDYQTYYARYLNELAYDPMVPVTPYHCLYPIADFTPNNITKLIDKHFDELGVIEFAKKRLSALEGGYILSVDNVAIYYPQCCGKLADIRYWCHLVDGQNSQNSLVMMSGHPAPFVKFINQSIIFDFQTSSSGEPFTDLPENLTSLTLDFMALKQAVMATKPILWQLAHRIKRLNKRYGLPQSSDRLWKSLIYDNHIPDWHKLAKECLD